MTPEDLKLLQDAVDSIFPGIATISTVTRAEVIFEEDKRPQYIGRNRLSIRTECPTCKGSGEIKDSEQLPDLCVSCHGLGFHEENQTHNVDILIIDIGHKTRVEISTLEGKGRADKRVKRTVQDLIPMVVRAVGQASIEVSKSVGATEKNLPTNRINQLIDVAKAAGVISDKEANEHKAAHSKKADVLKEK
jgi:hypothetical protein